MVKFVVFCTKVVAATIAAALFSSCQFHLGDGIKGNGNVTKQSRIVGTNFSKIDANRGLNVTIEKSAACSVEVEADDNLQSHITVKVENETLVITTDKNIDEAKAKNVHVKMPSVTGIETSSGASLTKNHAFNGTNILVKSSSGSESNVDLEYDKIKCESSSGSKIIIKGKALDLNTDSSSGSTIEAKDLLSNNVVSESTSGSTTTVHPILSLNGKASSGSTISYDSTPKNIVKEESSGGNVSKD